MTIVLSASVVVLAAMVFLLLGAQVEMHRDLAQVRELTGLIDRPTSLDIAGAAGKPPSAVGLPAELDEVPGAVVLFLSDKCSTCRSIAGSLDGGMPPGLWLVLDPADPHREPELGLNYRLDPTRVIIDRDRQISVQVGVTVTPAGVVVQRGRIASATTVPSTRRLYELLDSDVSAGPASATGVTRPPPAPITAKITQKGEDMTVSTTAHREEVRRVDKRELIQRGTGRRSVLGLLGTGGMALVGGLAGGLRHRRAGRRRLPGLALLQPGQLHQVQRQVLELQLPIQLPPAVLVLRRRRPLHRLRRMHHLEEQLLGGKLRLLHLVGRRHVLGVTPLVGLLAAVAGFSQLFSP